MAIQSAWFMKAAEVFDFRAGLFGVVGLAMSASCACLLWSMRDSPAEEFVVRIVLCALIVAGLVMVFDAWRGLKKRQAAPDAPVEPSPMPETRSRQSEVVSEFEVEGMHFLVLWKPGLCLLRTIESYGTPDARQYTASDLFTHLYDGSPDYELSCEQAIAQAPLVAATLVHEQRVQELAYMEPLYTSPQMQQDYPVYQVWQQQAGGVNYPVIWASHNAGLYWQMDGQWCVAGFAKSREEAEAKMAKATQSDED